MANMSHCRFQNTLRDLQDCENHFGDELSQDELKAANKLIALCKYIGEEYSDPADEEK